MRLIYVLLSPTFGMHQYTADLANRMADGAVLNDECADVHLVTTTTLPRDRYSPTLIIHTPITTHGTGFSREGLEPAAFRLLLSTILQLAGAGVQKSQGPITEPSDVDSVGHSNSDIPHSAFRIPHSSVLVHITGVHLWNLPLVWELRRRGIPVIHTLHDLDPHVGVRFGPLIRLWNRLIVQSASHILVHGEVYRRRLLAAGMPPERVTATPLLHLFLSHARIAAIQSTGDLGLSHQPWALFFGRLEHYKGIVTLVKAAAMLTPPSDGLARLILAGPGAVDDLAAGSLSPYMTVLNRFVDDDSAVDLFQRCGLLVLPYLDATQSALVAAAYFFAKPVIVTRCGALPEYVVEGQTGWVVPPGDEQALAACLEAALADPEQLADMGRAGRVWYNNQRRRETQTLVSLYQHVAST